MNKIPKGRIIEVNLSVVVPETATVGQVEDWLHVNILQEGGIDVDNPLYREGTQGCDLTWNDTYHFERTEIENVRFEGNSVRYQKHRSSVVDTRSDAEIEAWESQDTVRSKAFAAAKAGAA